MYYIEQKFKFRKSVQFSATIKIINLKNNLSLHQKDKIWNRKHVLLLFVDDRITFSRKNRGYVHKKKNIHHGKNQYILRSYTI